MNSYTDSMSGCRYPLEPMGGPSVDRVLSDYFRSEMPNPWPPCRATASTELPKPASRFGGLAKRYLALALSVLVLMGGMSVASDWLRGKPNQGDAIDLTTDHGADRSKDKDGNRLPPKKPLSPGK